MALYKNLIITITIITYMDYGVKTYSVVDWGVVCLLAATVGPIAR